MLSIDIFLKRLVKIIMEQSVTQERNTLSCHVMHFWTFTTSAAQLSPLGGGYTPRPLTSSTGGTTGTPSGTGVSGCGCASVAAQKKPAG